MERLVTAGHEVLGVCRSGRSEAPPGATIEAGDAADVTRVKELARDASVVYGTMGLPYPQWQEKWPPIVEGLITAAETAGGRLVFADNLYCYGPQEQPLREDMPLTDYGTKPALRSRMVRSFLDAHQQGRAPVAMVRASDFYGPRVLLSGLGDRVFPRILAGKPAQLLGDPDQPHVFTYVPDFARALETLGQADDEAFGQAWHVPNAPARSPAQVVERIGELASAQSDSGRARVQALPRFLLKVLGIFSPDMRELDEMLFQWQRPYEVDHSKFAQRFWSDSTPLDQGLTATLDWYRSQR